MAKNTQKNQLESNKKARKKYTEKNFKYQTVCFKIEEIEEINAYCEKYGIAKNTWSTLTETVPFECIECSYINIHGSHCLAGSSYYYTTSSTSSDYIYPYLREHFLVGGDCHLFKVYIKLNVFLAPRFFKHKQRKAYIYAYLCPYHPGPP